MSCMNSTGGWTIIGITALVISGAIVGGCQRGKSRSDTKVRTETYRLAQTVVTGPDGAVMGQGVGKSVTVVASTTPTVQRAGCVHATPVELVKGRAFVHLHNFEITGAAAPVSRVVTSPLYPHYPDALLPGKIGIEARRRLRAPVTLTSFYCRDAAVVRLFSFTGTSSPALPRPASASAVKRAGSATAVLTWPPPIEAPPDPPKWLVTPFFYKPGLAVIQFAQGEKVIDRLTFLVCEPRSRQAAGKGIC